jgi:phospholipid/cholesterol/gamma-HCH transport system substrate-binding protein
MDEQRMRFRIGIFALASIILLAVLITLFGAFPTLFKRQSRYVVLFNDAPGVAVGTPVRRSGVRIGEVKRLDLDDVTGKVRITIAIDQPHPLFESDQVVLVHGLLTGDTTIDFVPRKPNGKPPDLTPIEPGAEIVGAVQPDVATLLNQTSEMVPTTQETLNQIRKTLERFERMAPLAEDTMREYRDLARASREMIPDLQRTNEEAQVAARNWGRLGERLDVLVQANQDKAIKALENLNETVSRVGAVFNEENQRNVGVLLKNVRAGSESLESISKNADELVKDSRQTMRRLNESMNRADKVIDNLTQATQPLAERSASVMKNVDESTTRLNRMLTELDDVLRVFTQGGGSLQRFLADPSLYNNLNDAACALVKILPRVDRILRDFEVFSDKLARHPESIGLGGALRPSAGLKEAPTSSPQWPQRH